MPLTDEVTVIETLPPPPPLAQSLSTGSVRNFV
jgi:hypothetical protein